MNGNTSPFLQRLDATAKDIEELLEQSAVGHARGRRTSRPARLIEAMRYSSLGGGKRFRPFLVVESAALFEVPRPHALMAGAALECVHCYSLVHDDLPAMDNDDLRRGQPTAHKAFDEATAILAGDGLLTFAFDILSRTETHPDPAVRIELVSALARASGLGGMVGGQMLDLAAEGRFAGNGPQARRGRCTDLAGDEDRRAVAFCVYGRRHARIGDAAQRKALERYGSAVGKAFQIADDLLDLEGDPALVGKSDRQRRRGGQGDHCRHPGRRRREGATEANWSPKPNMHSRRSAPTPALSSRERDSWPTGTPERNAGEWAAGTALGGMGCSLIRVQCSGCRLNLARCRLMSPWIAASCG